MSETLSQVFSEFCESHTHLDSLLSRVDVTQKAKVAILFGAFLRRPLTIAQNFGIDLDCTPEEFWSLSFIRLKKNPKIHEVLHELWRRSKTYHDSVPQHGGAHDFPTDLYDQWVKDWGETAAQSFAKNLSQDPLTTIRLHRRALADLKRLDEVFTEGQLPKMREGYYSPFARVFKGFAKVQKQELFLDGWYEIQDEGSQVMSLFALAPELMGSRLSAEPTQARVKFSEPNSAALLEKMKSLPAMTVIDACAGAGGKTLAIADCLQGQGRVFGYDIFEKKILSLKKRVERARERNVQAIVLPSDPTESNEQLKKFLGTADRVLIDSPCSGTGVLRRNPDIKWSRKPLSSKVSRQEVTLEDLQNKVMTQYSPLVKTGGKLIYGVCTFAKSETVDQVARFTSELKGFELEKFGFVGPHETDGFFMASWIKK